MSRSARRPSRRTPPGSPSQASVVRTPTRQTSPARIPTRLPTVTRPFGSWPPDAISAVTRDPRDRRHLSDAARRGAAPFDVRVGCRSRIPPSTDAGRPDGTVRGGVLRRRQGTDLTPGRLNGTAPGTREGRRPHCGTRRQDHVAAETELLCPLARVDLGSEHVPSRIDRQVVHPVELARLTPVAAEGADVSPVSRTSVRTSLFAPSALISQVSSASGQSSRSHTEPFAQGALLDEEFLHERAVLAEHLDAVVGPVADVDEPVPGDRTQCTGLRNCCAGGAAGSYGGSFSSVGGLP